MTTSQQQLDQTVRHAVFIERLKTGQVNKFAPFLKRIDRDVRKKLSGHDLTEFSRTRFEKLLKQVDDLIKITYGDFTSELQGDLFDFASYEADFETRALGNVVAADFDLPSDAQLIAAVTARPLSIRGSGKLLKPWIQDWSKQERQRVTNTIRQGYYEGQTTAQIVRSVRGTKARRYKDGILAVSDRHANTVVRTAVQHVATVARNEVYKANSDIVEGYRWVSTLDGRTSAVCRSLDGRVFEVGKGPLPPIHPNCLLGDSLVLSRSGISNASKRWFEGEIIILETARGFKLSCTPNHPILTPHGWLGAGLLNEGGSVVCDGGSEWVGNGDGDYQDRPAPIKHVAESLLSKPEMLAIEVPVAPPHFHGDGSGSKVAIVGTNSFLRSHIKPSVREHSRQVFFKRAVERSLSLFSRCSLAFLGERVLSPCHGFMGKAGKSFSFLGRGCGHAGELLLSASSLFYPLITKYSDNSIRGNAHYFSDSTNTYTGIKKLFSLNFVDSNAGFKAARPEIDACFFENSVDGGIAEAEIASNLVSGKSGPVFFDNIVSVRRDKFSGHVYNLETGNHVYSANRIITHNCRSSTIPEISKEFDFLKEGRERASKDGPVADQNYYEWLKKQSVEFQNEALGPTRAKLLRNGGLTPDEFASMSVDKMFRPLNLAEMRRREPLAFERANL